MVNHIISECQKYQDYRNQFHISDQICHALGPNPQDTRNLISFLKKSKLCNLIKKFINFKNVKPNAYVYINGLVVNVLNCSMKKKNH